MRAWDQWLIYRSKDIGEELFGPVLSCWPGLYLRKLHLSGNRSELVFEHVV